MAIEIEKKFLLLSDDWKKAVTDSRIIQQGYFGPAGKASIRVRISGDEANINIKSATLDIVRKEFEIPVPLEDAREMITNLCQQPVIKKTRYYVPVGVHVWEVDVFEGDNEGLVVAEIELSSVDEEFDKPEWLGEEVSNDKRYYNVCLVENPFKNWRTQNIGNG